jgi:UPF0755 protein
MKIVKLLAIVFVLLLLMVGGVCFWIYKSLNAPAQHGKANQFIQIPKGASTNEIINKLNAEGIIKNTLPVQIYLRSFGDASKIQAGEYQFPSPVTPLEVLKEMERGEERTVKLTIPEGFTRFDIAKRIAEKFPGTPPMDERAILALMDDVSLIKDFDPQAKNLEGYMYPSTYSFPKETTPNKLSSQWSNNLKKHGDPNGTNAPARLAEHRTKLSPLLP